MTIEYIKLTPANAAGPSNLMVHYIRDMLDPLSERWLFNPLRSDFAGAVAVAREGYASIFDFPDATGFRIVDDEGVVITEEIRVPPAASPLQPLAA